MSRDEQFGPVITFGLGGIWIEVLQDISFGIAPLSSNEAEEMISSIRGHALLEGKRGKKPADREAISDLLVRLSRMAMEEEAIREMDLNPFFPLQKGVFIADARIIV
jgi:acetyltransferase